MSPKTTKHIDDAATQTDFQAKNKFIFAEELFGNNNDMILNQESKKIYILALKYVNKFHERLNYELDNLYKNYDVEEKFTCPNVPNYSTVFPLVFNLSIDQNSSESDNLVNKISQSNIKAIDLAPELNVLDHQSTRLNLLDYKIQDILKNISPSKNLVSEMRSKSSDISYKRELEINQNVPNKTVKENVEDLEQESVSVHLKIQENSKQVRKKSNLVQTSFNVVAIEPCIDLLEYARSKEKIKKLDGIPSMENIRPILPSSSIRPFTPKKVVKMFDAISQDSKNSKKNSLNEDSDDSIILDDEQFEQHSHNLLYKPTSTKDFSIYKHPDTKKNLLINEKANPLKLNQKDLTNINEKTLNTIGLFTNRGEIKPDVIDMLEREKSIKANDMRNKKFRSQRQWDLEIHLNPKTDLEPVTPSIVSEKSFLSYSDIKIHVQNVQSK